jgi:tocopherol O-methyltransferase
MRDLRPQISNFYNRGTQPYLRLYGPHFHDGYYAFGNESHGQAQEDLIARLARLGQISAGSEVLDVGCGVGGSSIWLAMNLGAVTTGITISEVQVNEAVRLAKEAGVTSEFLLMDAMDMKFERKFDVIWIVDALVHLPDQLGFLKTSFERLKPGGRLILFDWMLGDAPANYRSVRQVIDGMLLSGLFSMDSYRSALGSAGYGISYAEDTTSHTVKTWQDALSVTHDAHVFAALGEMARQPAVSLRFLRAVLGIRREMRAGRIRSGIIVASKEI